MAQHATISSTRDASSPSSSTFDPQSLSPDDRPASPGTIAARKHTHLGLRPKNPDSLHTRIRTSHPAPKHVSQIVDVTSADLRGRIGSARSSRNPSSDNLGLHSREATSREASIAAESAAEEDADGGRRTPVGVSSAADYEVPEDDSTTDIGIYDAAVYDEYLGPVLGRIRRLLIRSLEWETPLLARHQLLVRNPKLDRYFVYTSLVGSHSFFLIFLPISFWLISGQFSRGLVNVLAFGVYFSSAIKDALCIPRPYSPPVTRLVIGTFHLEYGFLSTHATNCISIVLYCYLWLNALRPQMDTTSIVHSRGWEAGLLFYLISVTYGRVYSGMHSVMDCFAGCILGAIITLVQWRYFEVFEKVMLNGGYEVPIIVWAVGLTMVIVHPQPLDDCPCFEDAIAFMSVIIGIISARWAATRYGWLPPLDESMMPEFGDVDIRHVVQRWHNPAPFNPLLTSALGKPEPTTALDSGIKAVKMVSVLLLGIAFVMATRLTVKIVCRILLPPIFRFVQGTFGFILPRRHYTSSTDYAAMQKTSREAAANAHANGGATSATATLTHKRQQSSGGGAAATSGGGTYRPTSMETEGLRQRMRSHSMQSDKGGSADKNTVKFTLGDGKDIPVPFTHPNTHLPGDTFSERIAGALSHDERERQRRESEASLHPPASALNDKNSAGVGNGNGANHDDGIEIAHYDVDVLTKVFVYAAVGFSAGGLIPMTFRFVGLLPI